MTRALVVAGAVAALVLGARTAAAEPLTEAQQRGRHIYLKGTSTSGRAIQALIGDGATVAPASALPCAGCHGRDGRGVPEAGLAPPTITWAELTKPYDHVHPDGRRHPPYTADSLALTILYAADPRGERLHAAKPTYAMAEEDLADLVAYLTVLGTELEVGVTASSVRVGTVLPATGPLANAAAAVHATLTAYFEEINRSGGIYDRALELRVADGSVAAPPSRSVLDADQVFAVVAPFAAGVEPELTAEAERAEIPVVGPFALFPPTRDPVDRYVFHVLAGMTVHARTLVEFAARHGTPAPSSLAVVHARDPRLAETATAAEDQARRSGFRSVTRLPYGADARDPGMLVEQMRRTGVDVVLFLGPATDRRSLLGGMALAGFTPVVLVPGALLGADSLAVPAPLHDRIFVTLPPGAWALSRQGATEYTDLARRRGLDPRYRSLQLAAFSSAKVFVEALKRAGRSLTREKLVAALEDLRDFDAGFETRISFGPNRRTGAVGAYVVRLPTDGQGSPFTADWVVPRD